MKERTVCPTEGGLPTRVACVCCIAALVLTGTLLAPVAESAVSTTVLVTKADGSPAAYAWVAVHNESTRKSLGFGQAGADGKFVVSSSGSSGVNFRVIARMGSTASTRYWGTGKGTTGATVTVSTTAAESTLPRVSEASACPDAWIEVVNSAGAPVSGAAVVALALEGNPTGAAVFSPAAQGSTNNKGAYSAFSGVPDGSQLNEYVVAIWAAGYDSVALVPLDGGVPSCAGPGNRIITMN
ncbi:MAG: carboxypeptidase regulatory-like domain-containing protein [Candidatus Schekmanbacteria bacterium]|nr:carboxypeptidase regulatory-like domain-containing protein [Candidatus Schekmanbacteria bacterium]